jgi:hypothetical protein
MNKIPFDRVQSHADFGLTPLGRWADRHDVAAVMPAAPPVGYLTCLPNPFCPAPSVNFEEAVDLLARGSSWTNRCEPSADLLPGAPRNFGSRLAAPSKSIF